MLLLQAAGTAAATTPAAAVGQDAAPAPPRQALGARAQQLLGAAAEVVALLGCPTLAAGLGKIRERGRRMPSALERDCRALDAASALLRHPCPCEVEADVARLQDWLTGGGGRAQER